MMYIIVAEPVLIITKYSMQVAFPHIIVAVKIIDSLIMCGLETVGLYVNLNNIIDR